MVLVVAVLVGLLFGAVDQYLGTVRLLVAFGSWPSTVSGMSATWLLLPFLFGCTQRRARRAMLLGLVATQAALAGYLVMTLSPIEGVSPAHFPAGAAAWLSTNLLWVAGGLMTGPLYGLLGQRWRVTRSWVSVALVTGALTLEPLAREAVGQLPPPGAVWGAEAAIGLAAAVTLLAVSRRSAPE